MKEYTQFGFVTHNGLLTCVGWKLMDVTYGMNNILALSIQAVVLDQEHVTKNVLLEGQHPSGLTEATRALPLDEFRSSRRFLTMATLVILATLTSVIATASAFVAKPCTTAVQLRPLDAGDGCTSRVCARSRPQNVLPTTLRTSTVDSAYELDGKSIRGPLKPLEDTVLVEVEPPKDMTDGGLFIPSKKDEQPTRGTVQAVGGGKRHWDSGAHIPIQVNVGERVVYGSFDGTSVKYQGKQHLLMRDTELLMAYDGDEVHVDNLRMVGDRVLVRVKAPPKGSKSTSTGVLIAQSATRNDRPTIGVVVKVGPGRLASNGKPMPTHVKPGDRVKFKVRRDLDSRSSHNVMKKPRQLAQHFSASNHPKLKAYMVKFSLSFDSEGIEHGIHGTSEVIGRMAI